MTTYQEELPKLIKALSKAVKDRTEVFAQFLKDDSTAEDHSNDPNDDPKLQLVQAIRSFHKKGQSPVDQILNSADIVVGNTVLTPDQIHAVMHYLFEAGLLLTRISEQGDKILPHSPRSGQAILDAHKIPMATSTEMAFRTEMALQKDQPTAIQAAEAQVQALGRLTVVETILAGHDVASFRADQPTPTPESDKGPSPYV